MDITHGLPQKPTPPANPEGRPSDYKAEYCQQLIDHMASGYSLASFAGKIGVTRVTLYNWRDSHSDFAEAMAIGEEKSLLFWETIGINGTIGVPVRYKGKEYSKFNASIYALNMANKHKWTNRQDVTTDGEKIDAPVVFIPEEKNE